jgi:hypothetical protein
LSIHDQYLHTLGNLTLTGYNSEYSDRPFAEKRDPRGLCKDVTNVGRWGNGDVEVGLEKMEDLPHIIGLVRRALELQLGDEE